MSKDQDLIDLATVREETPDVAFWLAKLDRGDLSRSEKAEFKQWLNENSEHKTALRDMIQYWYGLSDLLDHSTVRTREVACATVSIRRLMLLSLAKLMAKARPVAVMAVLAVVVVSGALFVVDFSPLEPTTEYHATKVGQANILELEDGSTIHLNTNTILEKEYSSKVRVVRLISGEAVFDVAHDKKRPFLVYAGNGVVRAIGTRFSVRVRDNGVSVTVAEGKVAVADRAQIPSAWPSEDSLNASALFVARGEAAKIELSTGTEKEDITESQLAERLSWTNGQLVFYDQRLESVVDEVSRYTTVQISFSDDVLKEQRITGILPIGEIETILEGIELSLALETEWISNTHVQLSTK
ncbi:FecR family protein [Porticoccus sp. GXU_MW_L64]